MTRSRRDRQLPFFPATWMTSYGAEYHTKLSQLLLEFDRVPSHDHTWQFVRGAGNGVQCAIGRGKDLYEIAREDRVVEFLRFLKGHESPECLGSWISLALDHRTTWDLRSMLYRLDNYPSQEEAWWNEREYLEERRAIAMQQAARYSRY